jgi:drug/metabolite transporter (DMT)-like permease
VKPNSLLGCLLAVSAALLWGVSGVCAQFLFATHGVRAEWLVTIRMLICGITFLIISLVRQPHNVGRVWQNQRDALSMLSFGLFGMMAVQYSYFFAIRTSNAATATVLQYTGPAVIAAWLAFREKRRPTKLELASTGLALLGTWLLVTHGHAGSLVISGAALFWGLLSAFALAAYSLLPIELMKRYSASIVIGWGMLIGGGTLSVFYHPWNISGMWDMHAFAALLFILIFGTLLPFYGYLKAVQKIGAHASSIFACAEPVSAAVVSVVFLGVTFGAIDWLGTAFIVATVLLLALSSTSQEELTSGLITAAAIDGDV